MVALQNEKRRGEAWQRNAYTHTMEAGRRQNVRPNAACATSPRCAGTPVHVSAPRTSVRSVRRSRTTNVPVRPYRVRRSLGHNTVHRHGASATLPLYQRAEALCAATQPPRSVKRLCRLMRETPPQCHEAYAAREENGSRKRQARVQKKRQPPERAVCCRSVSRIRSSAPARQRQREAPPAAARFSAGGLSRRARQRSPPRVPVPAPLRTRS